MGILQPLAGVAAHFPFCCLRQGLLREVAVKITERAMSHHVWVCLQRVFQLATLWVGVLLASPWAAHNM